MPGRGSRDALLFLVSTWLLELAHGNKIAFYCSDVSGAFDKVDAERLIMKLRCAGMSSTILEVLRSWLCARQARVEVDSA